MFSQGLVIEEDSPFLGKMLISDFPPMPTANLITAEANHIYLHTCIAECMMNAAIAKCDSSG